MGIADIFIKWYKTNKRNLPWRNTKDPYSIWVSEIILQQTQVKQGTPYYLKFMEEFPNVRHLAKANIDEILLLWQGLGYYSRARNMHFAAKQVLNEYNGVFPTSHKELLQLKGIGEYTAAAIASFCFNEQVAAIDGNVYRVISRIFDIETPIDSSLGKKEIKNIANEIISKNNPADFNQAIMDFGATLCKPKSPVCNTCPINTKCLARKNNSIEYRPVKTKKTKQRIRYFIYMYITDGTNTIIEKRSEKDIWEGLYQLPLIESDKSPTMEVILNNTRFKEMIPINAEIQLMNSNDHILSHQIIKSTFVICNVDKISYQNGIKIKKSELSEYAFPTLLYKFFKDII